MSGEDFAAWLDHMGLSDAAAARALELSRNSVAKYKIAGAPRHVALACAALAFGLPAWRRPDPR